MNISNLQTKIEQAEIKSIVITRMPDTGNDFWFVFLSERQTPELDLLTIDNGCPVSFDTLDEVLHLFTQWGYDGAVDIQWTKAGEVCN